MDFVYQKTGKRIVYIGHSQGTSQMFAALSDLETSDFVTQRVEKFIALAPVCFLCNVDNPLLKTACKRIHLIKKTLDNAGIFHLPPTGKHHSKFNSYIISFMNKNMPEFANFVLSLNDVEKEYDLTEDMPKFLRHFPSGASFMQIAMFAQMIAMDTKNPVFRKFHYENKQDNLDKYGTDLPPVYDFNNILIPVSLHVGLQDKLANPTDCEYLRQRLQEAKVTFKYELYDKMDHQTFMWGRYPQQLLYNILNDIRETEGKEPIHWDPDIHGGVDWKKMDEEKKLLELLKQEVAIQRAV